MHYNEWDIIASINNVFDKKPPIVGDNVPRDETTRIFNTLPGVGYQIPGRTFVMRIARRF